MSFTIRSRRAEVGARASPLRIVFLLLAALALALAGCSSGSSSSGSSSTGGFSSTVALTTPIDPGSQCPAGGYQIDYGIDVNQNGTLDPGEVQGSAVVCNGTTGGDGDEALVTATPLAAGQGGCAAGGSRLDFGLDANGNGTLDSTEILGTATVCNGSTGPVGATALIASQTAPPDDTCPAGGVVFSYGLDNGDGTANNGVLDPGEVAGTREVCNGQSPLVAMSDIAADDPLSPCGDYGGTRIDIGFDNGAGGGTRGNGVLDGGEATLHNYLCAYGSGVSESGGTLTLFKARHSTVAATGTSLYQFTTGIASLDYRIRLSATDSVLSWALYDNDAMTGEPLTTCPSSQTSAVGDVACVTGQRLTGNTTYYVAVTELSNVPDLFDIEVRDNPRVVVADDQGYFYEVDPFTGEIEEDPVSGEPTDLSHGTATPGVDGFQFVLGDPATGYLYAMTSNSGMVYDPDVDDWSSAPYMIYRIDPFTLVHQEGVTLKDSAGTLLAESALPDFGFAASDIESLVIDAVSGQAMAWVIKADPEGALYSVDLETGVMNVLENQDYYGSPGDIMAMSFDGSGNLYLAKDNDGTPELWMINMDQGESNYLGDLAPITSYGYEGSLTYVTSFAVGPDDGRLLFLNGNDFFALDVGSFRGVYEANLPIDNPLLANLGLSKPIPPPPAVALGYVGRGNAEVWVYSYRVAQQQNLYWSDQPGIDPADPSTYLGQVLDLENSAAYESGFYYYDLDGLYPGTTYYFLATAVLEDGTVVPSRVLTVTPPSGNLP